MRGKARRLFVLLYGAERVPKSLSLRGGSEDLYWEPLLGVLVETDDGWLLFDTGMARGALESDDVQAAYHAAAGASTPEQVARPWSMYPTPPHPERWNWGLPGDPMEAALASVGLAPSDLFLAVISHLHLDHSGGIPTLAHAGVPVAIQRSELEFAMSGTVGLADGFREADWEGENVSWRLLDGDEDLAPGVAVLSTPGHTPGHSSLRVDLPVTGTWIFTADATDLSQNLMDEVPCGSCAGGTQHDEEQAAASLKRLLREAAEHDARLIPCHDQVMANAIRHPLGGHH
jgi:N-acyl homoserine lactone hydrolase